ncbi:MAG: glycosyltransferase family 39 protein [Flavobacteriales bacterium]|nr:glycosyltransferase family 39 protein [Flavobacteriales bacterium]
MKFLERLHIPSSVLIIGLFIIALIVRLLNIDSTDIAGDEPFSIFMAQFSVSEIIAYLNTGNNPPLFEILLHYYMLCFGDSDFFLRLFPTIFSALTVIPVFLIGDRFLNRRAALTASLLFIFSIYNIRFAHEVRVYSFFALVVAWQLFFFLAALKEPLRKHWWLVLAGANATLLYAHYLSFYVLLAEGIVGLIFLPIRQWKFLIGMFTLSLLSYSPMLMVFMERFGKVSGAGTWVQPPGWGELYGSINLLLNSRITTVMVLLIAFAGIAINWKNELFIIIRKAITNKFGITIMLWFIIPYLVLFLVSKFYLPMFIDRYILFTSIPLFLAVAWVVDELWARFKFQWLGGFLLVAASIITTNLNPSNDREIAATAQQISALKDANTDVYIAPSHFNLAFAFHYNRNWFRLRDREEPMAALDSALRANRIFTINKEESLNTNAPRIIYLDAASEFVYPNNSILETLRNEMIETESHHHHQIFDIYVFEQKP